MSDQRSADRVSAGILVYRLQGDRIEVLLGHPGGPFFLNKDEGHWSIPKGEVDPGDELLATAVREFTEETGHAVPDGDRLSLGMTRQKGGKIVHAWAVAGDLDPAAAVSNRFSIEWPRGSGTITTFPELDRVEWFDASQARLRIKDAQVVFIDRLEEHLAAQRRPS